jgi:peptidoglycan/xylan/chitin deacetylase (PgdA/CDA1 family)
MRVAGHIFCSRRCARLTRRKERLERLKAWNRTALMGVWFRMVLFGCLLAGGVLVVWLSSNADRFMSAPEVVLPKFGPVREREPDREKVDWESPGSIVIDEPADGAQVTTNTIEVQGHAPSEAMVGLYVNGQRVSVELCKQGRWSFQAVPLTQARNILQARYFDNRGNSSYGPAVRVDLRAAPARLEVPAEAVNEAVGGSYNLIRAPVGQHEVLLTFDGGSGDSATEAILDDLQREHVRATFFLTGMYMRHYPDLVRRIAEAGYVVGNHTFSHPHLTTYSFDHRQATLPGVTEDFVRDQLLKAAELYKLITGKNMAPYWRAPFGEFNSEILAWAHAAGFNAVYWTPHLDTLDWVASPADPLFRTPQQILAGLLKRAATGPDGVDGGIILMHLGSERPQNQRVDVILPPLIESLKRENYRFVTVDQVSWGGSEGSKPGAQ